MGRKRMFNLETKKFANTKQGISKPAYDKGAKQFCNDG